MKRILTIWLIALLVCSGCAWFGTKSEKSAQELASDGMDAFNNGKYTKAIESFEKLKDWYPFSKFAILAELKIADAHYHLQAYDEAIFAYEAFESLHPRNEAIPYVIYQIGLCYFERLDTIDRDQTVVRKANNAFQRLVKQFPDSAYANKARKNIKKCHKTLAMNELYVALFYYKSKHYEAALSRFKAVISSYPDVGVHYKALQYITLCEASINKQKQK